MEYENGKPVTRPQREARRKRERAQQHEAEEQNRRKSQKGGQPNELGITQGQNAEQGNTTDPRNAVPSAKPGAEH